MIGDFNSSDQILADQSPTDKKNLGWDGLR